MGFGWVVGVYGEVGWGGNEGYKNTYFCRIGFPWRCWGSLCWL